MSFDYARSWMELIRPRVESLPEDVRMSVQQAMTAAKGLTQGNALNIPMDNALRGLIESIPEDESYGGLAGLSALVYRYGQWKPGKEESIFNGVCWKFSNMADQVLRDRLNTVGTKQIHEGILRATYSDKHTWTWFEVGLANKAVLEFMDGISIQKMLKNGNKVLQRLVQKKAPGANKWDALINPMKNGYVTGLSDKDKAELKLKDLFGDLVLDLKISPVEWTVDGYDRGHPFMITNSHLKGSLNIDPNTAPCGVCKLPYSAHHHEDGLHVWVTWTEMPAEFKARLVSLNGQFVRDELAGVAFHKVDVPKELI